MPYWEYFIGKVIAQLLSVWALAALVYGQKCLVEKCVQGVQGKFV